MGDGRMTERHVRPDPKGGWKVTDSRNKHASSHHQTDVQAIAWAKTTLRHQGTQAQVVVHDREGGVRTEPV